MKSVLTNSTKAMFVFLSGIALVACNSADAKKSDNPVGSASQSVKEGVRLTMIGDASTDDVTAFDVVIKHNGDFVVSDCVPLEEETLPSDFLMKKGAGDEHNFADKFFVLAADDDEYSITVTPMKSCDPMEVSENCKESETTAIVKPGETTEVVLLSYCDMPDSGAVDIISGLQHDPTITDLQFQPSKFIQTCEELELTVQAEDQDGDEISYQWEIAGPDGALYETSDLDGESVRFMSKTPGTFKGLVTVCDVYQSCASLSFPIYVQMSSDENNNGIGDECDGFQKVWTLDDEFEDGSFVNVQADGDEVQLSSDVTAFDFLWVAVSSRGTAVKIDTATGDILGEYRTAPSGYGLDPSRTTVDQNGSAWVTNRAECSGNHGSVVKIGLAENPGECEDRNNDGIIQTSTGLGDVLPWSGSSKDNAEDECVVQFVRNTSCGTRHVSVNADNNVWISGTGGSGARAFDLIDGNTGAILRTEASAGYGGYGGLMAPNGSLWSARPLMMIPDPSQPFSASGNRLTYNHDSYGLCVNADTGEVWNTQLSGNRINRFAPDGTLIGHYTHGNGDAQGCVVDGNGHVWVAHSILGSTRTVGHLLPDGTHLGNVTLDNVRVGATGVAVDGNGNVWATGYYTGRVYRINPSMGAMGSDGITPIGAVDLQTTPGGNLYNYSDMTGSTLIGAPGSGSWQVNFNSGEAGTDWEEISWDAVTPGDSSLSVTMSVSDDGVTWSAPAPQANGADPNMSGQYVRIIVSFTRATTGETPVLEEMRLSGN